MYYVRDAREGLLRNANAVIATTLLIVISLSITGLLFLLKSSAQDVIQFLNSQVKIKVLIEPLVNTDQVAAILANNKLIQKVEIERKEEMLQRLKQFFNGKEYLLLALSDSDIPDAILIELVDKENTPLVAEQLKNVKGITDVIYAQKFANTMISISKKASIYGTVILIIFLLASIMTIAIAINLALYQRQKEVRIKLLLGAKEIHVRGQFLFEGWLLGLIGSILASICVFLTYQFVMMKMQWMFQYIFQLHPLYIQLTMLGIILGGSFIGLLGSYLSTRSMIKHA